MVHKVALYHCDGAQCRSNKCRQTDPPWLYVHQHYGLKNCMKNLPCNESTDLGLTKLWMRKPDPFQLRIIRSHYDLLWSRFLKKQCRALCLTVYAGMHVCYLFPRRSQIYKGRGDKYIKHDIYNFYIKKNPFNKKYEVTLRSRIKWPSFLPISNSINLFHLYTGECCKQWHNVPDPVSPSGTQKLLI